MNRDERGGWNYRVMRKITHDPKFGTSVSYGIVEAYYAKRGDVLPNSWTEEYTEPFGETMAELIANFGHFMAALIKPILDHNGSECEPAAMLADDLQAWADAKAETQGEA